MLTLIGFALMLVGGLNMVWFVFWLIMAWSATAGAQLSKQVGTSNGRTDSNIRLGKRVQTEAFQKFTVSASLLIVGSLLYHFAG